MEPQSHHTAERKAELTDLYRAWMIVEVTDDTIVGREVLPDAAAPDHHCPVCDALPWEPCRGD